MKLRVLTAHVGAPSQFRRNSIIRNWIETRMIRKSPLTNLAIVWGSGRGRLLLGIDVVTSATLIIPPFCYVLYLML